VSKVVKGVGRAVSKVVDGVKNVVKQVTKSKLGKVLVGAALIYFGGAALMGSMGFGAAGAAGASGLTGAAQGISAAWTSLGTAGSQLMAGNFANAAGALGSGIGGSAATMGANGMLVNGAVQGAGSAAFTGQTATGLKTVGTDVASAAGRAATASPWTTSSTGLNVLASEAGKAGAGSTGLIGKMMASPYAAPALISSGTQLAGGLIQGVGARQEQKRQEQLTNDQRAAYNTNIGTRLFA
jgi:hypothetical protein